MSIWRTWCACVCTLDGAPLVGGCPCPHCKCPLFHLVASTSPLLSKSSIQEISFRWLHSTIEFTIYNTAAYIFTIRPPHIFASIPAPAHALSGGQTARLRRNRERLNSSSASLEMTSCRVLVEKLVKEGPVATFAGGVLCKGEQVVQV